MAKTFRIDPKALPQELQMIGTKGKKMAGLERAKQKGELPSEVISQLSQIQQAGKRAFAPQGLHA